MKDWKEKVKQRVLDFLEELEEICTKCGRKKEEVKVVYATKYLNPDQFVIFLHIAYKIDILPVVIGENRIQEGVSKFDFVRKQDPRLMDYFKPVMIGNLQTNKINKAINIFSEIHSVDSQELADALNKQLEREGKAMPVFLEVNVSREITKHGFSLEELVQVYKSLKLLKSLKIKGIMTMAPYFDDPERTRPIFQTLRRLADRYNLLTSMGMSHDWKVAVEEGADMIRIGSTIFK